jgi:hypothetical protein
MLLFVIPKPAPMPTDRQYPTETLPEFLDRRERELTEKVRKLRAELTPLETEIIQIRRAKTTLGGSNTQRFSLLGPTPEEAEAERNLKRDDAYRALANTLRHTPPGVLKIKDLIVLAFVSHFQNASAGPLAISHYIRGRYKRQIDSASIRPNLGRLREDGILMQDANSKWVLDPTAASVILPQYHAADGDEALLKAAEELAWREEDDLEGDKSKLPYGQVERPVKG